MKPLLAQTVTKHASGKSIALVPQVPTARPSSKTISVHDQLRFNAAGSFPTFRRQEHLSLTGTSKVPARQPVDGRSDTASRTESVSKKQQTEELSSSSEESDEEEESQTGLAALGKFQRSPKVRRPAERRQVKMLDVPGKGRGPVNDRLNQRNDARRIALRLKPDISGLHRALLSWDYDHVGPEPPTSGEKPKLVRVPDRFADHKLYHSIFEPLLLLECWSQIVQSKDQKQEICDCKISSRQFINDWVDLDISISELVPKDWYLAETDVVLLRHLDGKKSVLAKVQSYKAMPYGIQATLRSLVNRSKGDPGLEINSSWRLSKVFR
jgi:senataxin